MRTARRFAVVGSSGFLGRQVVHQLRSAGHEVVPIDRQPGPSIPDDTHIAGVEDYHEMAAVLKMSSPDVVVNLAYLVGTAAERSVRAASTVNVLGQANILQGCVQAGVRRYVYASSIAVYGPSQSYWGDSYLLEETTTCPMEHQQTSYGATKVMNEFQARLVSEQTGLETCGLRLSIVLGPGRERGLTTWTSDMIVAAHTGRENVDVPARPDQRVNLIGLRDAARCMTLAATASSSVAPLYNSGGHDLSAFELGEHLRRRWPGTSFAYTGDQAPTPFVNRIDAARIRTELAFVPASADETLAP